MDLPTSTFAEVVFEQLEDTDSELSSYFSVLTIKFIQENLGEKEENKFSELLEHDQDAALEFASEKIPDFKSNLANYLQKHLQEVKSYLLP